MSQKMDKPVVLLLGGGFVSNAIMSGLIGRDVSVMQMKRNYFDYFKLGQLEDYLSISPEVTHVVNCVGFNGGTVDFNEKEHNKLKTREVYTIFPKGLCNLVRRLKKKYIHIGSGCIFQGDHMFKVGDVVNFGLDNEESSWYCKCKHEADSFMNGKSLVYNLRIRMPITPHPHARNLFSKVLTYHNILAGRNSVTFLPDFVDWMVNNIFQGDAQAGTYHCVNETPIELYRIKELAKQPYDIVDEKDLKLKAKRSTTTLTGCLGDRSLESMWARYERFYHPTVTAK